MIEVIVDSREAKSGIARRIAGMPGFSVDVCQLDAGDFLPAATVCVERKRSGDFAASILDGRIQGQVKLMKATYDKVILLIEGSVTDTQSRIEPAALMGALSWISLLEGISIVHTVDEAASALLIATMARHAQQGLGYEIPLRSCKPKDLRVLQQYLVEGLPGIGPGKALVLIDYFGSVRGVLTASPAELARAPGIGAKTAERIVELLSAGTRP